MDAPLHILHVEDDPLDTEIIQTMLEQDGVSAELRRVDSPAHFEQELRRHCYKLILADYTVPGMDPMETLQRAREICPESGFLFVSGTMGEERAIEALKLGALDYVLKQRMDRLVPAIRRALREVQEQQRRREAEDELRKLNESLESLVAQRTRELSNANASLQVFADTAAHDLRAPLRAISSFSKLALTQCASRLDTELREYLERISSSADDMSQLLSDLLDYSRMSQADLKTETVDLTATIRASLALLDSEIRARGGAVTVSPDLPAVLAHASTLQLLITNLLSNALKFVRRGVSPVVSIHAEQHGRCTRIVVADNGIGIDDRDRQKIFGVFQRLHSQTAYPGTGLGLAIVKKGAERMGGTVGLESTKGSGSRFWIELPTAVVAPVAATA